MGGFLYGIMLQWKLDIRSRTLLLTCYLVPLLFFAVMGGIFTSVMPGAENTLIQSMTVFGVTMGALIGLPPSLVEIYAGDVKKVYAANGVPVYLGFLLANISAFIHLFLMSILLYMIAPIAFDAAIPAKPLLHFAKLAIFIGASLGIAGIIGLAVKNQAQTSMFSILIFLPSVMLSGIMFPAELLPRGFESAGKFFPAAWGYAMMCEETFRLESAAPLLLILIAAAGICAGLLKKLRRE